MSEEKKELIDVALKHYLDLREQARCVRDEEEFAYQRLLDLCRQAGAYQDSISEEFSPKTSRLISSIETESELDTSAVGNLE